MRESYHGELAAVIDELVGMTASVRIAVQDATTSLLGADLAAAERVIANDARLDAKHDELEERCFNLLARQAPVAGELRTVLAALRMVTELGRMGDLAAHIAKIARLRFPEHAVPDRLVPSFSRMATVAEGMVAIAGRVLAERNVEDATKLADNDDEMDRLRSDQFRVLLGQDWTDGVEAAVDAALLGRYYERIADHAVAMGGRIIYIITGEAPAGENWPTT